MDVGNPSLTGIRKGCPSLDRNPPSQTPPAERVAWWVGPPQRRLSRWLRRRA